MRSLILSLSIFITCLFGQASGKVTFLDRQGTSLNGKLPVGSTEIIVQVDDVELSGNDFVDVLVTSAIDIDGEQIRLPEISNGIFQEIVQLNFHTFRIIEDEGAYNAQVNAEFLALKAASDNDDEDYDNVLKDRANDLVYKGYHEQALTRSGMPTYFESQTSANGILDFISGDFIEVVYRDNVGNTHRDNARDITVSGYVEGTWLSDSTYIVTGDVYVNYDDTLTIEPGVVVKFNGNYGLTVYGSLFANGAAGDSIIFEPYDMTSTYNGMWKGIKMQYSSSTWPSKIELSYFRTSYGGNNSWPNGAVAVYDKRSYSDGIDSITVSHGEIHNSSYNGVYVYGNDGTADYGQVYVSMGNLWVHDNNNTGFEISQNHWTDITLDSLNIHDGSSHGMYLGYNYDYTEISVDSARIADNANDGLYCYRLVDGATLDVENADIHDNGGSEVGFGYLDVGSGSEISVTNSTLYDDVGWVVYAGYCCYPEMAGVNLDFRQNDWGATVTAEMNSGTNPQDIDAIYDYYENTNYYPFVNYAGYAGATGNTGYSGEIGFQDANGNSINDIPLGSTILHFALYDADLDHASASVTVVSESDPSGETVALTEGEDGHFSGTLTLNETTFRVIENEEQFFADVEIRLETVAEQYPDWSDEEVNDRARADVYEIYFAEARERDQNPVSLSRDDGILDVTGDDAITLTYFDEKNDWGSPDTVTSSAVFGGISGSISGTFTAANSPYVVSGDIYVDEDDSLTIEAGVVFEFFGNYDMDIDGYMYAVGSDHDSIYFRPFDMSNPTRGMWGGITLIYAHNAKQVTMSYFSIAYGGSNAHAYSALAIRNRHSGEGTHISHGDIYGSSNRGVTVQYNYYGPSGNADGAWQDVELSYLNIHHNNGYGLYDHWNYYADVVYDHLDIHDNNTYGLVVERHEYPVSLDITGSTIQDNSGYEIYVGYFNHTGIDLEFHVNNNTITDDDNYYLVNLNGYDYGELVDFRLNNWGSAVTDSMNSGTNPQDIDAFIDWYEDGRYPRVNYAGYVGATGTSGYTADLAFLDENGNQLESVTGNSDSLILEVFDADLTGSGTVTVAVTSSSDNSGETVTLSESNSGQFLGSVALNHGTFRIIEDIEDYNDDVGHRINELTLEHSDWDTERIQERAKADIYNIYLTAAREQDLNEQMNTDAARDDGILDVGSEDQITMTYTDAANDWGAVESLTHTVGYDGISGGVEGTWTVANSPYMLTGDTYIWENDSLIIEPGVEVLFAGQHNFHVRGYLYAVGTESDSIVFQGLNTDHPANWHGVDIGYNYNTPGPDATLSYFRIDGGGTDYYYPNAALGIGDRKGNIFISHGLLTNNGYNGVRVYSMDGTSTDSAFVTFSDIKINDAGYNGFRVTDNYYTVLDIKDVLVKDGYDDGFYVAYNYYSDIDLNSVDVKNCFDSGIELYYNYSYTTVEVELSNFKNNATRNSNSTTGRDHTTPTEIHIRGSYDYTNGGYTFNNNNIINEQEGIYNQWLVRTTSNGNGDELDFTSNYWGPTTTHEMDSLGSRANISSIYDNYDYSSYSTVEYDNWHSSYFLRPMYLELDNIDAVVGDTVMVGVHVTVPSDTHFISTEMTLTGFQDRLDLIEIETSGSMVENANWTLVSNSTDSSLYIAAAGAAGISGQGMLFWIKLGVPDNDSTGPVPIHVANALFNSGGYNVNVSDGSVYVLNTLVADFYAMPDSGAYPLEVAFTELASGGTNVITSYQWDFGDGNHSTAVNPVHMYNQPGVYTVSLHCENSYGMVDSETKAELINVEYLYGDVDFNAVVQAYDAGLILQDIVEYIELDSIQSKSGDVSGDSSLSALDASLILQYVVHLIDELPYDTSDGHLLAIGSFGVHDQSFAPGQTVEVPIHFTQASNVYSVEGVFEYNPDEITFEDVNWAEPFTNFMKEIDVDESGNIQFAIAGASAVAEDGYMATLQFTIIDEDGLDYTDVRLVDLRINEEDVVKIAATATLSRSLSTDDRIGIPDVFALKQNYPNPFNPVTRILYDIPDASFVTITIYDLLGHQVRTLVSRYEEPGYKSIVWNATNNRGMPVSAGMYLYSIKADEFRQTRKMLLLK